MRPIREIFAAYEQLDAQGRHVWGTDRHGPNHQYGDAYEGLFLTGDDVVELSGNRLLLNSNRSNIRLMLEVGVADGNSLLAWAEVFPNARIVGLDLNPPDYHVAERFSDRIEFYQGDVTDKRDLDRAVQGRQLDIIVDDASHQLGDVLTTLLFLWPSIRASGLYVVEDLNLHLDNWHALLRAEIVPTTRPSGNEPLIVLRKT